VSGEDDPPRYDVSDAWNLCITAFGKHFMYWVLAMGAAPASPPPGPSLSTKQGDIIQRLSGLAMEVPPFALEQGRSPFLPPTREWLALRGQCGGSLPVEAPTDDALLAATAALAEIVYAPLLARSARRVGTNYAILPSALISQVPEFAAFADALRCDTIWGMFSQGPSLRTNVGRLRCPDDACLASYLLSQAWDIALLRGQFGLDSYRTAAVWALENLRASLDGNGKYSVFLGFRGCITPPYPLNLDRVSIYPYSSDLQFSLLPSDALPSLELGDLRWTGFVAEVQFPFRIMPVGVDDGDDGDEAKEHMQSVARWSENIALAIALARLPEGKLRGHEARRGGSPSLYPSAPVDSWQRWARPLMVPHVLSNTTLPVASCSLDDEHVESLEGILKALVGSPLQVAIVRVLMALQRPRSPDFGLIDTMIAWESIAGDSKDAISLITRSVLSSLVFAKGSRAEGRKRIKEIYGVRNRIVHGVCSPDSHENLREDTATAIEIALRALRSLHLEEGGQFLTKRDRFSAMFLDS